MQITLFTISLVLYYFIHSLLANSKIKTKLTQKFISIKYYRLFFNFIAISTLLAIVWFYFEIDSTAYFSNPIAPKAGLFSMIIGGLLVLISLNQYQLSEFIGTQQLTNKVPTNSLVTSGLNQLVRHPLYFSILLLLWGFFLYDPISKNLIITLISSIYIYIGTRMEEQKLVEIYGEDYISYQKEVPMLIPFLKF